ncbi:hypothetical protein V8C37DRAFT_363662 [Trichoderma ceciliae]
MWKKRRRRGGRRVAAAVLVFGRWATERQQQKLKQMLKQRAKTLEESWQRLKPASTLGLARVALESWIAAFPCAATGRIQGQSQSQSQSAEPLTDGILLRITRIKERRRRRKSDRRGGRRTRTDSRLGRPAATSGNSMLGKIMINHQIWASTSSHFGLSPSFYLPATKHREMGGVEWLIKRAKMRRNVGIIKRQKQEKKREEKKEKSTELNQRGVVIQW